MKKQKTECLWGLLVIVIIILALLIIMLFLMKNTIEKANQAKDFCENKLNGTIKPYDSKTCLFERDGIIYGLKVIKYEDEWKVFVE